MAQRSPRTGVLVTVVLTVAGCANHPPQDAIGTGESAAPAAPQDDHANGDGSATDTATVRPESFEERLAALEAEIAALWPDHPWAAEYSASGTDDTDTVSIAPLAGYVYRHQHLRGNRESWGTVEVEDGWLVLVKQSPDPIGTPEPTRFVPVRWGERRFLLEEPQLIEFCNFVNQGRQDSKAANRAFLMCRSVDAMAVSGKPDLPPPYRKYILDDPLAATVTEMREADKLVVLNVGSDDGVFVGMELLVPKPDYFGGVEVVSVTEATCEARSMVPGDRDISRFVVGFELTSRR